MCVTCSPNPDLCNLVDMNGSMASACATSSSPLVSVPSACPSSKKAAAAVFRRRRTVSCRATGGGGRGDNDGLLWLPRRDVMLSGLSGVAAGLAGYPGLASGADNKQCPTADKVTDEILLCTNATDVQPCPLLRTAKPDKFEPEKGVTRVRRPVHLLSPACQDKYIEAVKRMKALPASNPLSFAAQAAIHQAYCDSYYKYRRLSSELSSEKEKDDPVFDVHFSWIFAPWHRMYIYFYEKALRDLIGDEDFALPYWSWDAPAGMVVPPLFKESTWTMSDGTVLDPNPLYDANRNPKHLDQLMDLGSCRGKDVNIAFEANGPHGANYNEAVNKNLCTVYFQQQVRRRNRSCNRDESFLGGKYCTGIERGKDAAGMGTLESMAHTAVHIWVGKAGPTTGTECSAANGFPDHSTHEPDSPFSCKNDMGFLGSAANDPLFYSHHSNVDRMWHLWSTQLGGKNFDDKVWLDTSFVFYDDVKNPRKVRIKFCDVLDTANLGYTYADSGEDMPWEKPKIECLVPHVKNDDSSQSATTSPMVGMSPLINPAAATSTTTEEILFDPIDLTKDKEVVVVPAVAVPGMASLEKGTELVLVIDRIGFDSTENNKFDVAINVPKDKALQVGPQYTEYAGSFAAVPGSGGGSGTRLEKVSLCITDVLADIEAAGARTVDVVIVRRTDAKMTLNARPTIEIRKS